MKKMIIAGLITVCMAMTVPVFDCTTAYAGDINEYEQELLEYMTGVFEYEGKYYKATDAALARLREELLSDSRDLNARQVKAAKNEVVRSFKTGLDSGYMYEVPKPEETTTLGNVTQDSGETSSASQNNESNTTAKKDKESTKPGNNTQEKTSKNKEENTSKSGNGTSTATDDETTAYSSNDDTNVESHSNIFPQESETYPTDVIVNTVDMESIYNTDEVKNTGYNLHPLLWGFVIIVSATFSMSLYCIRIGEDEDETHN